MKRRITIILTAVLIALSLTGNTLAATPPTLSNLIIHKYALADLSDAGASTGGVVAGTIPTNAKPLSGVQFDVYKIILTGLPPGTPAVPPSGVGVTYALDSVNSIMTVTKGSDTYTYGLGANLNTTPTLTAADGTATFTLTTGYYLVVENLAASSNISDGTKAVAILNPVEPFVVPVPMTDPTGNSWLTDIHVYPKNQPFEDVKNANKPSVSIGQEVEYTLEFTLPHDITTDGKQLEITDVLDPVLTYKDPSVSVKIETAPGTVQDLASPTNYSADYAAGTKTLTVTFNETQSRALTDDAILYVSFTTTGGEGILTLNTTTHAVENRAAIAYTNTSNVTVTGGTNVNTVHTGQVEILKVADDAATPLAGATFQIADTEANAKAGNFLKKDATGNIVYPGDTNYGAANVWQDVTLSDGKALFSGLADSYYDTNGAISYNSYWVVETQAPAGYNLLTDPVQVTFDNTADYANLYTITKTIVNTPGFVLPATGGFGTVVFTVAGISLIGLAALLLVTTRRKKTGPLGKSETEQSSD